MALYKLSDKDKKVINKRRFTNQTKGKTKLVIKLPSKNVTVYTSKSETVKLKKAQANYDAAVTKRNQLKNQIDNVVRKGGKPTKKLQSQYDASKRSAKRYNQSVHKGIFGLPSNAITETSTFRTDGKIYQKKRTQQVKINHKVSDKESVMVVIKILTPLITTSDIEHPIGDYVTIQLAPQDNKTVSDLLDMQMTPYVNGDDYKVINIISEQILFW